MSELTTGISLGCEVGIGEGGGGQGREGWSLFCGLKTAFREEGEEEAEKEEEEEKEAKFGIYSISPPASPLSIVDETEFKESWKFEVEREGRTSERGWRNRDESA